MLDFEGASEAVNSRHEYNERTEDIKEINTKIDDIDNSDDPDLSPADKTRLKKNLEASKTQYQNELNEIAKKHTEHVKTLKKSIVEKLNSDPEVLKKMGRNIKVSEIDFDKYSEKNIDPKSAQFHFNKLVDKTTSELNDRMKKVFDGEKIDYKEPGYLSRLGKFMTDKSPEGLLNKAILLSIAGDVTEAIIAATDKKDIDAIIKSYNGCYQVDITTGDLIAGPCNCAFDFSNDDHGVGTCSDKIVLSTKNTDLKKLITDNKPSFCTRLPNNMVVPCKYASNACAAYQSGNPLSGSCTVGQCKNPSGENDPNSGKWQDDLSNNNIEGIPVCISTSQYVMELFDLNDQSVDWVPTPTPPLIIIITIIGILMILLTVLWYIIFLIRQERKMGKK
jgi:hypothetical protein